MNLYSKRWGRIALLVMMLGLLALGLTTSGFINTAQAADVRYGSQIVVAADEVIDDDLIVYGQTVEIEGTVKGDVIAMGREITINGDVEGSVAVTGQIIQVNGDVTGSVYVTGYSLIIGRGSDVDRNVMFTGFSLITEKESTVGRGVYVTGYQTIINGEIADDVVVTSSALKINGAVGGNVEATVNEAGSAPPFTPNFPGAVTMVAPGYRVGEEATIGGEEDIETASRNVDLGETFSSYAWRILRGRLGEFIALLLVGGLLLWLWPGMVQSTTTAAQKKPLPSAGWGCIVTLAFPILMVLGIIALIIAAVVIGLVTFGQLTGQVVSIGAVSIAWIAVVFNFILFTVTKVIVALAVGRLIMNRFALQMKPIWLSLSSLALGALIYQILRVIPVLGWFVALITILVGLGAMFIVVRQRTRPAPASIPPLPEVDPIPEMPDPLVEPDIVEEPEIPDLPESPDETDSPDKSDTTL
jgi:cytoskeletal protein CcmA (bactofilin family)